jgi:hypothetical protein
MAKDYKSLTDVQLKYEVKKLEHRILGITGDPIEPQSQKFFAWAGNERAVERVQGLMSTRSCILNLLFERHCSPAEVARLEQVNELLLDLGNRTYRRTADLAHQMLSVPHDDLDDNIRIEGKLVPEFDSQSSVLQLEYDNYYCSDFVRMAAILQETAKLQPGIADVRCYPGGIENFTPEVVDKELGRSNVIDDGASWAEAWLAIPPLAHITICHALHTLVTYMSWSIPDVLRINDYRIEVSVTYEQYSCQHNRSARSLTLHDLILRHSFQDIAPDLISIDPEGVPPNLHNFWHTFDILSRMAPGDSHGEIIDVSTQVVQDADGNELERYLLASHCEGDIWDDCLAKEVIFGTSVGETRALAQILWQLTISDIRKVPAAF